MQHGDMLLMHSLDLTIDNLDDAKDFPSWAFRADIPHDSSDLTLLPSFFTASSGLEPPSLLGDVSRGADVLLVEGIILDNVAETTITYRHAADVVYRTWLILVKDLIMRHNPVPFEETPANHRMYTAMAYTLTASQLSHGKRAEPEDMEQFARFLNNLEFCHSCLAGPKGGCSNSQSHVGFSKVLREIHQDLCTNHGLNRRFFVTRDGGIGLGPSSLCADDIVVILRGGDVPFIMRRSGEFYRLVGPAYVHGMMDGEGVDACKARNQPEVLFAIR
jgi:hypothetical protein